MRRFIIASVALPALLLPTVARAEDGEEEEQMVIVETPAAQPPPEEAPVMIVRPASEHPKQFVDVSYASQTLLLDGAAVAMFAFGVATETKPLPGLGILTYSFG